MIVAGILALAGVTVFGLFMAVFFTHRENKLSIEALRRRIGVIDENDDPAALLKKKEREGTPVMLRLLTQSGLGWSEQRFWNLEFIALALALIAGSFWGLAMAVLLAALAGASPLVFVLLKRRRRLGLIEKQFPDAMSLMVLSLRAGHALPGAVELAAREAPEPLKSEMGNAVKEHGLGRPLPVVLQNLAERVPTCEAAQSLAVAIAVLEQTGGNLIGVIDRITESARQRQQYAQKLRALTAQGKLSAWILGAIPPLFGLLACLIDPNYSTTLSGPGGALVIGLAVTLWLCGLAWTVKLVTKQLS